MDGKVIKTNANLPYKIEFDKADTAYKVNAIAIDSFGKSKKLILI